MAPTRSPSRVLRTRRGSRKWSLLLLAGLPLLALHAGLLVERAMHLETLDAIVVLRWSLAVALLVLLKRVAPRLDDLRSPGIGIAAILIFGLIHLPVAAPEPSLPIAATGFGLALSLVVVDRGRGTLALCLPSALRSLPEGSVRALFVSRDVLKDRAPPQFC